MESRNISVTLEQAREWYDSDNSTLKTLALNAYSVSELIMNFSHIKSKVETRCGVEVPYREYMKYSVLGKLAILARYFNCKWEMCAGETGYFISKSYICSTSVVNVIDSTNSIAIFKHNTVQHAGIVYFKNAADAEKAAKILGNDIRYLF